MYVTFKRTIHLALFKYLIVALSGFTCPDYQNYGQHWGRGFCHNIKEAFDILSSEQYDECMISTGGWIGTRAVNMSAKTLLKWGDKCDLEGWHTPSLRLGLGAL